jgi:hypothetical protein
MNVFADDLPRNGATMSHPKVAASLTSFVVVVATMAAVISLTSSSAAAASSTETVVGAATITGAPSGWQPSNFYTFYCPAAEPFGLHCSHQLSGSPNQTTGRFSTSVPAKAWKLGMYYYTANGQMIPSGAVSVPADPGATIHRNVSMKYVVPAVGGSVAITGAPKNFQSKAYMGVQACPGASTFSVGCRGGQEAYENVYPGATYIIDLSPGHWTVADYYISTNNPHTFAGVPSRFTAISGATVTLNVTMKFQGF